MRSANNVIGDIQSILHVPAKDVDSLQVFPHAERESTKQLLRFNRPPSHIRPACPIQAFGFASGKRLALVHYSRPSSPNPGPGFACLSWGAFSGRPPHGRLGGMTCKLMCFLQRLACSLGECRCCTRLWVSHAAVPPHMVLVRLVPGSR